MFTALISKLRFSVSQWHLVLCHTMMTWNILSSTHIRCDDYLKGSFKKNDTSRFTTCKEQNNHC